MAPQFTYTTLRNSAPGPGRRSMSKARQMVSRSRVSSTQMHRPFIPQDIILVDMPPSFVWADVCRIHSAGYGFEGESCMSILQWYRLPILPTPEVLLVPNQT